MQALKVFVIFMGLLIVAGLALVVYAMLTRVSEGPGAGAGFDETALALPAGCSLAEARAEAGRLIVRTEGPMGYDPCQQIIIIDLESGEVLGRVRVERGP